jgi:hypothetical protein
MITPIPAASTLPLSGNPLLNQASTEIGVNQTSARAFNSFDQFRRRCFRHERSGRRF